MAHSKRLSASEIGTLLKLVTRHRDLFWEAWSRGFLRAGATRRASGALPRSAEVDAGPSGTAPERVGAVWVAQLGGAGMSRGDFVRLIAIAIIQLAVVVPQADAQMVPSTEEIAAYRGLHAAAYSGDVAAIDRLAPQSQTLRETRDPHGRTPLHVATHARQRGAVRALLRAGADPGALDRDRYDAVTIAAVADDAETLQVLLAHGASAKLITSRYDGTALIAAAHLGHAGVVQQLIAAGAPLDHVNNLHWTALIEAIVLGDGGARHQATLRALLDAGASTILVDRSGRTPLYLARDRGYAAMVKMLDAAGAR